MKIPNHKSHEEIKKWNAFGKTIFKWRASREKPYIWEELVKEIEERQVRVTLVNQRPSRWRQRIQRFRRLATI